MNIIKKWTDSSLILKIIIGLIIGIILGITVPNAKLIGLFGNLFVAALRAIAPILVFALVSSAISKAKKGTGSRFKVVIILYLSGTFLAALVAVFASYLFPIGIQLTSASTATVPQGFEDIITNLLTTIFSNPIAALANGDYLGILFWAIVFGMALNSIATDTTKDILADVANSITLIVRGFIQLAPIGIMGLVFKAVSENGLSIFTQYGQLIMLLVGCMLFVALIENSFIVGLLLKRNPFPLVLTCLRESGITAFFSRSSAANIPINLALCEKLGLDKDFYSLSIPLGATINMQGAAITITIMTLAVANTLGIHPSLPVTIVLCLISTLAACGSSGVAGGSLLLIPMACSLFGISNDIAMQAISVGFIIGVIQDSCETALDSSGDALFSAAAEYYQRAKRGKDMGYLGVFKK